MKKAACNFFFPQRCTIFLQWSIRSLFDAFLAPSAGWFMTLIVFLIVFNPPMQLFPLYVLELAVACAHAGPVRGRRGLPTWSRPRSGPAEGRPAPSLLPSATNAPASRRLWASGQFFLTPTKTWPLCCRT